MNNSVCTSYEQSKSLLELGLDPNTADMKYDPRWDIPVIISEYDYDSHLNYNPEYENTDIPAWSLSALLGLMPYYELIRTDSSYELSVGRLNALISEGNETHIDLAVDMVIWLLENGYISRKNQGLGSKAEK